MGGDDEFGGDDEEEAEKAAAEQKEKPAEEIWMASQMLWMVSQVFPAFADTADEKKAVSAEQRMPNNFAARILECDVAIPDVLKAMTKAVNSLCVCRPSDTTGATEHGRPAVRMKEPSVIHAGGRSFSK